ncbi:MAG: pilin [Candidatus Uhrbacteria bacterium]
MKNFCLFVFASCLFVLLPLSVLAEGTAVANTAAVVAEEPDPADNVICWMEEPCVSDWDNNKIPDGLWDAQSSESMDTCGGEPYGYCYAYPLETTLSVGLPLGGTGVTTVQDLGDYINKLYIFLLSISGIIAILMIMIGGIQYVVSRGGSEAGEAKKRIYNAMIGVVLLFFANVILYTVNPQLIRLMLPQIPKARTVFFVSDETSCEALLAQNIDPAHPIYELKNDIASGNCGDAMPEIVKINGSAPNEKKYCSWTTCSSTSEGNPIMACMRSTVENRPFNCMGCSNIYDENPFNVAVTSEACTRLSAEDIQISDTDKNLKTRQQCFKTNDTSIDITGTSCALMILNCSAIATCESYQEVKVTSAVGDDTMAFIQTGYGSDLGLQNICEDDPCQATRGDTATNKCQFKSDALFRAGLIAAGAATMLPPAVGAAAIIAATTSDHCISVPRVETPAVPSTPSDYVPQGGAARER